MQTKSLLNNMDALQNDLTVDERREILKTCVRKMVLSARERSHLKKEFLLTVFFNSDYASELGNLEIIFSVSNSKGKGEWIITSPSQLKCENYGIKQKVQQNRGIKRHWLNQVVGWRKKMDDEKISIRGMEEFLKIKKSMILRKLKLLENLSHDALEFILNLKYAAQTERISFRKLEKISFLPKDMQLKSLSDLLENKRSKAP